jgi:DNA end-binding protein Ku
MARALWSGSISFGLVNIPVKVATAVSEKEVRFHMLHGRDGARIRLRRVCSKDGAEVPNEDIVRGYEVARGEYVTFTDQEIEAADPKAARTIDIQEFVALDEIDPAYYDRPYYLLPDKNADKAYALLLAAMQRTGKVAIARVVMREKEYLVALRPKGRALMMETMHFADEVVPDEKAAEEVKATAKDVDAKQLALAERLIESLTEPFQPAKHRNTHRDKLLALVEAKVKGHKVVVEPLSAPPVRTVDLLAALESSLSKTRHRQGAEKAAGAPEPATGRTKRAARAKRPRPAKRARAKAKHA